jgi:hypothetical protein
MSSLQNLQISLTFPGLIKTNDESAITGTLKTLQDGAGNNLPIEVSTTGVNFTGTVTGIPASGGGLENGADFATIQTTAALTPDLPAAASGFASIAFGRNSISNNDSSISMGNFSTASGAKAIAIGSEVLANFAYTIAIGWLSAASANDSIALGRQSNANQSGAVALGSGITASTANTVSVKELETQIVGGGITMYSPNGTKYKLTVSDAGAPVFTAI